MMADTIDSSGKAEWRTDDGCLQLGRCNACHEPHYYPRRACPFCFSLDVGRMAASGMGTIYSHSRTSRGTAGPYILAYVTLDEGVTMLTNIVDAEAGEFEIGQRVVVEFRESGEGSAPFFRPARPESSN